MHIHILGICGTFMAGVARIAKQLGHRVSGSDSGVYPPMSTFLRNSGIEIYDGYNVQQFAAKPDLTLIGNALSRGNEAVEYVLDNHLPYQSGAQWLAEEVLRKRRVIAVSGTHGKTTTTSILSWILSEAGADPGFLIGGLAPDLGQPSNLGSGEFFVIEADEYDTAFFDKRSKFVHYRPDILIINNLEFDHADIFSDLDAIKTQFHHLIRTVPAGGTIIYPAADAEIADLLSRGNWSRNLSFGAEATSDWRIERAAAHGEQGCAISSSETGARHFTTRLLGDHNRRNASAAYIAAYCAGLAPGDIERGLASFTGVKRRLELIAEIRGVRVYDDFAHHPTAITASLQALRDAVGDARVICILEPRSNTMRSNVHTPLIARSLTQADAVFIYTDESLQWPRETVLSGIEHKSHWLNRIDSIIEQVAAMATRGDHIVIMSNGGFGGIHESLQAALQTGEEQHGRD